MILREAVLPFHAKDAQTLPLACRGLREALGIRRIALVGAEDPKLPGCEFIDEARVPDIVGLEEIRALNANRAGWLYQQLLKLGAPQYVPGLAPQFLVCDADVVFLRNVYADAPQDCFPWAESYWPKIHAPYRECFERLTGHAAPQGHSFINHHMVFEAGCLADFKARLEQRHGRRWDRAILSSIDAREESGFSEYEFYAGMMWKWYPHKLMEHPLRIKDIAVVPTEKSVERARAEGYDLLSSQEWVRRQIARQTPIS